MKRYLAALILSIIVLCAVVMAQSEPGANLITGQARTQTADASEPYTAVVKANEAQFAMPVPQRSRWKWRLPETRDNAQEYRMDVTVKNGGSEYTFGFYLWKRAGAKQAEGSFSDLLGTGQKSLFERTPTGRGFSLLPNAGLKVSERGDKLLITISGRDNVERLFYGKPAEVTFKIVVPGEGPKQKTVPVKYQG